MFLLTYFQTEYIVCLQYIYIFYFLKMHFQHIILSKHCSLSVVKPKSNAIVTVCTCRKQCVVSPDLQVYLNHERFFFIYSILYALLEVAMHPATLGLISYGTLHWEEK